MLDDIPVAFLSDPARVVGNSLPSLNFISCYRHRRLSGVNLRNPGRSLRKFEIMRTYHPGF